MAAPLPQAVMIWFGAPIIPRRCGYPRGADRHNITDPPLQVDELAGLLTGWQHHHDDGWRGQIEYQYPFHGYGLALRLVDWFPADRLRTPTPIGVR